MTTPKLHLFVCTNCTFKGAAKHDAADFRANLKSMCKNEFTKAQLRVNSSGCLGQCEHGIAAVLYPQGEWFFELRPGDERKLLERLRQEAPHN